MLDIAIKGGTVVNATGIFSADVGIENDKIAIVAQRGALPPARKEIDADGLLILPGIIDIHFHVRAPGHPARATFASETRAAAAGGVTTLLEMPISIPGTARRDILENRKALALSESYINVGMYGAPGLLDRDEILGMADAGACGFKVFTHAMPKGREDEFLGICIEDEGEIYQALELTKETGLMTVFHAENEPLIKLFGERIHQTGRKDPMAFVESRPPVVEAMSVAQLRVLCQGTGARVHIAHVSCEAALRELQLGQAAGLPMTGETCPHYLFFTEDDMKKHGPFAMIKPPLRTVPDQDALWAGLLDGSLMAITTDHSPFTLAEKERGINDIWKGAIGAPSIEALVPGVMTEALMGRITLEQAICLLCTQPAELFGFGNKGIVQAGYDADLTLYDPNPTVTIDSKQWLTKAREINRLYQGRTTKGKVKQTIVNGTTVFEAGKIQVEAGVGKFVSPDRP